MSDPEEGYIVNVVFRGLFLARSTGTRGFAVLLPDARTIPGPAPDPTGQSEQDHEKREKAAEAAGCKDDTRKKGIAKGEATASQGATEPDEPPDELLEDGTPYREHHGLLEFSVADWANPTQRLPNLTQIHKPHKDPVAFYFLNKQEIRFRSLLNSHTELPLPELRPAHCYREVGSIRILEDDCAHGFNLLPPFGSEPKEGAWRQTVAFTLFTVGEVFSERLSAIEGVAVPWEFRRYSEPSVMTEATHFINLDLRIRYRLASRDSLVIELFRHPKDGTCNDMDSNFLPVAEATNAEGVRTFILHPEDREKGLTIWVKNRELSSAVLDSDLLPDPFQPTCNSRIRLDRDHGLLGLLAVNKGDVVLPFARVPGSAQCGQGCGGCGG